MTDHPTNPNYRNWKLGGLIEEAFRLHREESNARRGSTTIGHIREQ